MDKQKVFVFIGAHPDDESFGVGGTLAQYAAAGVNTYYICMTGGEAGDVDAEILRGYETMADLRMAELQCAADALGLKEVIHIGYRDSGMPGWEENNHPDALMNAPLAEAAGRIVKELRRLKPDVVATFDPIGGYRHPDHIATHNAAVRAFYAAGDPTQCPEAGPPFQPKKLYYHVLPHRFVKWAVKLMPLFGRDPHHFGKNRDVDLVELMKTEFPVHAVIRIGKEAERKRNLAAACHASQLGGEPPRRGILGIVNKIMGAKDSYMRAEPPVTGRVKEKDLFEGIP
jgi:LmbE family N-acetylglucosaminyl deacetylase